MRFREYPTVLAATMIPSQGEVEMRSGAELPKPRCRAAGTRGGRWYAWVRIVAIVAALGLAVGSCTESGNQGPIHLIPEPPDRLRAAGLFETVFTWRFSELGDLAGWEFVNLDGAAEISPDGLLISSSGGDPYLWRQVDLAARSVQIIRIHLRPCPAEHPDHLAAGDGSQVAPLVQLFWAGPGQEFDEIRQVSETSPSSAPEGDRVYEFPVSASPEWTGTITRLRIDPTNIAGDSLCLVEVAGLRRSVDYDQPWRVELDHEIRSSILVPAGEAREFELLAPSSALLRFGYGLAESHSAARLRQAPVVLRVVLSEPSRLGVIAAPNVLFTAAFPPGGDGDSGWFEGEVDLGAWSNRRLKLRFESPRRAGTATGPVVVVGNPQLVSRDRETELPNVILISLDALRADHLSLYGYRKVTSPAIDAWARQNGVTFLNTVAASPWTLPSHVSMLTGRDALRHGVNYIDSAVAEQTLLLPELLRAAGYRTAAITGGGYVDAEHGFGQGFDRFRWFSGEAGAESELHRHTELALQWLDQLSASEPFFLFFHTYEIHSPYRPREPYFSQFGGRHEDLQGRWLATTTGIQDAPTIGFQHRNRAIWESGVDLDLTASREIISALYDSGIAAVDHQIGRLLNRLRQLDLAQRTVVILTSDHGESLGEHQLVSHQSLDEEVLMVPLVVAFPERFVGGARLSEQVRTVDILPTILDLVGLDPPLAIDGLSLVPRLLGQDRPPGYPAWSYAGWTNYGLSLRTGEARKLIFNDSPWQPICSRESFSRLDHDPTATAGDLAEVLHGASAAHSKAMDYLAAYSSGLRLDFANTGPQRLAAALSGPPLLPWTLKALGPACGQVEMAGDRAIVTIWAGQRVSLIWQDSFAKEITITVWSESPDGSERGSSRVVVIRPRELSGTETLAFDGEQWSQTNQPPAGELCGVTLRWQGSRNLETIPDPWLERQRLRALGYQG